MKLFRHLLAVLALTSLSLSTPATAGADKPLVIEGAKIKQLPTGTTLQLQAPTTSAASINLPHGTDPTSPTNGDCWTTTAGLYCRINGSTVGPYSTGSSGGSVAWTLITTWTWSTNVVNVDFTGLGSYSEVLLIFRGITFAVTGQPAVQLSTNNGSSFFSGSTDYLVVPAGGVTSGAGGFIAFSGPNSLGPVTAIGKIEGINVSGVPKFVDRPNRDDAGSALFVGSTSVVNAIRFINSSGGNITAGTVYVLGR